MVKVKGFPRPLYPQDATGYAPSVPGPDVQAYKRTISRAGRWPWSSNFNQNYTKEFARGQSANVVDTGVAGVQRQQHLDATGYLGRQTFNTLRSIVIPNPLPHAGEMAMDDYAVNLVNQAWDMFGGHEPPPPPKSTLRQMALQQGLTQVGYHESPPGSNMNKYGAWYGLNGAPWCAMFVTWCFETVDNSPSFKAGSYYSYVPYIVGDARNALNGLKTTDQPIPGDLVCYDWNWDGTYDHVGIFQNWIDSNAFRTVEGNTSSADNSNGGEVQNPTRYRKSQGTVFVRVAEP
jgi:hypothetical protein